MIKHYTHEKSPYQGPLQGYFIAQSACMCMGCVAATVPTVVAAAVAANFCWVVAVCPMQAHVEEIMDAAHCLTAAASGQVELVGSFSHPLRHLEGSNKVVL